MISSAFDNHFTGVSAFNPPVSGVQQVGDIESDLKGTGARYNNGKPDYSLVLLKDLHTMLSNSQYATEHNNQVFDVLLNLSSFQETHDPSYLESAIGELGLSAFEEATYVLTYGSRKYKAWNWAKGMPWSVPLSCAVRHLLAAVQGQEYDDESGKHHTAHVVCNILMLLHYSRHFKEGNDLPPVTLFT